MSQTSANLLMLLASFIWGTAFVAQTTGMDYIGPFTFSFSRTFLGCLVVIPFAFFFEKGFFNKIFLNKKFFLLALFTGFVFFIGMNLQQYALLRSNISNVSFLTSLYVPIVAIISRFIFKSKIYWIIWVAVLLCVYGSYLITNNQSLEVQQSDILAFLSGIFFAIHIICIDVFIKKMPSPFTFAFIQYTTVVILSFIAAIILENPTINNIKMEWVEILYVGLLSTGVGYTLQIIGQSKAQPASAAILLSMESVFATLAGWFILNQFIDNYKIFGCCCIFCGVIFVHISPIFSKKKLFYKK